MKKFFFLNVETFITMSQRICQDKRAVRRQRRNVETPLDGRIIISILLRSDGNVVLNLTSHRKSLPYRLENLSFRQFYNILIAKHLCDWQNTKKHCCTSWKCFVNVETFTAVHQRGLCERDIIRFPFASGLSIMTNAHVHGFLLLIRINVSA